MSATKKLIEQETIKNPSLFEAEDFDYQYQEWLKAQQYDSEIAPELIDLFAEELPVWMRNMYN